jgi:hypothetical protein
VRAYPTISLSIYAGGLGLRAWHSYVDCAHIGQWAQAYQSSLYELADGTHNTYYTVYPALCKIIAVAKCLREPLDGASRKPEHLRAAYDLRAVVVPVLGAYGGGIRGRDGLGASATPRTGCLPRRAPSRASSPCQCVAIRSCRGR